MIVASRQNWTSRVLERGRLGIAPDEKWKRVAYEQYKAKLRAPDYPCFFGQAGEERGEMLYTFISDGRLEELVTNMRQFVSLIGTPGYERSSLVGFFEPDAGVADHPCFVARFWQILQFLHDHDCDPADDRDDPMATAPAGERSHRVLRTSRSVSGADGRPGQRD